MPRQALSEHEEPMPFIFVAYAVEESIGADMEREKLASAVAVNRLKNICFMAMILWD
jgi:hypothetical protein